MRSSLAFGSLRALAFRRALAGLAPSFEESAG
jgi:hypothetical protein